MKSVVFLIITCLLSWHVSAETILRVGTWLPPTNPQNAEVWPTWAKWVEDATEGRVKVKLEYGLGHPKSLFTMVEDGVVDAAFSVNGYLPGRFRLDIMSELPGMSTDAEAASVALWRTHQKYFASAGEFEGLELLGLFVHGPGQIYSKRPVNSVADLATMKIRIGGGVQGTIAERIGITPVQAPAPKVYEMLQQGVVDGAFLPLLEQKYMRLNEVTSHVITIPGGLYASSFSFFANPDFMDSLEPRDRDAIRRVSGEQLSALAGRAWSHADQQGYAAARDAGLHIMELGEQDKLTIELRGLLSTMEEEWVKSVADLKIDTPAALGYFKEQVATRKAAR